MAWTCSECGCSREAAERKRKRLGFPALVTSSKTCSPSCARAREKRLWTVKYVRAYWLRIGARGRRREKRRPTAKRKGLATAGREWRCIECGCSFKEAQAKRRRRGESPITGVRTATCSAECQRHRKGVMTRWAEHQRQAQTRAAVRRK